MPPVIHSINPRALVRVCSMPSLQFVAMHYGLMLLLPDDELPSRSSST